MEFLVSFGFSKAGFPFGYLLLFLNSFSSKSGFSHQPLDLGSFLSVFSVVSFALEGSSDSVLLDQSYRGGGCLFVFSLLFNSIEFSDA